MLDPWPHLSQSWRLAKSPARGPGVVVTQAHAATQAGVNILDAGGNAVDAAVAAAFALAAVEPWNSGLGGIGFALVQGPADNRASLIDFGPVAPAALDPAAFRLTGRPGGDLFGWPEVAGGANVHGPLSPCMPAAVAGYAALHAGWGRLPWAEVLAPAIALARRGLPYDWFAALRILQSATLLRRYPETARIYLPGGLPRAAEPGRHFVPLGNLVATLARLAEAGPVDMTHGDLAASIVADLRARGGAISMADMAATTARVGPAAEHPWRGGVVQAAGPQTAGPALFAVLAELDAITPDEAPSPPWFAALAAALRRAQAARLGAEGSTTHLCVADAEGGVVALTTTLLSAFGSGMVLPETGVLMNNGVMWFDPRPGRPNSIAGGARPLTNMCPVIFRRGDRPVLAAGASGGRRILPAVAQALLFTTEFAMDPEAATAHPRIDVSDPDTVCADPRLPADILAALQAQGALMLAEAVVSPGLYAAPCLLASAPEGWAAAADLSSPWSSALAAAPAARLSDLFSAAEARAERQRGRHSSPGS